MIVYGNGQSRLVIWAVLTFEWARNQIMGKFNTWPGTGSLHLSVCVVSYCVNLQVVIHGNGQSCPIVHANFFFQIGKKPNNRQIYCRVWVYIETFDLSSCWASNCGKWLIHPVGGLLSTLVIWANINMGKELDNRQFYCWNWILNLYMYLYSTSYSVICGNRQTELVMWHH